MQDGKRASSRARRSGSVRPRGGTASPRTASISSQRAKPDRSHSLQSSSGTKADVKSATSSSRPRPTTESLLSTSGTTCAPPTSIREQLPVTTRPSQLLPRRAALRGTSVKANRAAIPDLLRQIRQLYTVWSDQPAGSGSPGPRGKAAGPHGTPASTVGLHVVVEGRSFCTSPSEDGGKASSSKPPQEAVTETVLPVQQLGAILFPSIMDLPANCANRRNTRHANARYWKVLLHKSNATVAALMAAARGEIVSASALAAAELLTLLYNILRNAPSNKQKRLIRLSDKLGLMSVCGTVLRTYAKASDGASKSSLVACEAAGLLLALAGSYNAKVAVVARISRMLSGLLDALEGSAAQLAAVLSEEACVAIMPARRISDADEGTCIDNPASRLAGCERLRTASLAHSTSTLHLMLALFSLSKSSANAAELGGRCAGCVALVVQRVAHALTCLAPLVNPMVQTASPQHGHEDNAHHPTEPHDTPLWLIRWLSHVEFVAFWSLGLWQRLSNHPATTHACVLKASKHQFLLNLQRLLRVAVMDGVLSRRFELVQSILMSMAAVLRDNRAGGLAELTDAGGLPAIVDDVLALPSATPAQWWQLYACLCSVYGVTALPTKLGQNANVMNRRLPATFSRLYVKESRKKTETPATTQTPGTAALSPGSESIPLSSSPVDGRDSTAAGSADGARPSSTVTTVAKPFSPPFGTSSPRGLNLLPVDEHPDWFSPELAGGVVQPATSLPPASETIMPWKFTDVAPPGTGDRYYRRFSLCGSSADFSPLMPPTDAQRTSVLHHHVARLKALNAFAHDGAPKPCDRHVYDVVYERGEEEAKQDTEERRETQENEAPVDVSSPSLRFASNFESGNLQRAIKIAKDEYDLVLSWDTASNSYTQWFCFCVTEYEPAATYRFNIINMEKNDSTFNEGQRPLLLHVPPPASDARASTPADWTRAGQNIFYFKSPYSRHPRDHLIQKEATAAAIVPGVKATTKKTATEKSATKSKGAAAPKKSKKAAGGAPTSRKKTGKGTQPASSSASAKKQQTYYTASFCVTMPPIGGRVYLCNCFPFTYSDLRRHIEQLESDAKTNGVSLMVQSLCTTPGGLAVPLLTATSSCADDGDASVREKPVVLLDARVHPGETNGSWVMQGILDLLLAPSTEAARVVARHLLDTFVFKIIPMLNVDGVVMGNHRCSIPGFDLNRDYSHPDVELNPVVYSMKRLIQHMTEVEHRKVVLYGDFHGHSKAKNFLLYGCTRRTIDVLRSARSKKDGKAEPCAITAEMFAPEKLLPSLLSQLWPAFSIQQSNFGVLRSKRGTARISIYREFGVRMSLGVEGTMMGGRGAAYTLEDALRLNGDGTVSLNWCGGTTADGSLEETHYNQDTYRTFGAIFLVALYALTQCEAIVTAAAAAEHSTDGPMVVTSREASGMRCAWTQAQSTGSTREPPKLVIPTEEPPTFSGTVAPVSTAWCSIPDAVVVAGPYVLATRAERREGESSSPRNLSPVPSGQGASVPVFPPLSLGEKVDALHYLLRSPQLTFRSDEEEDDGGDDDGDPDDVEDDNSEGGDVTGEAEATVDAASVKSAGAVLPAVDHWVGAEDKSCSSSCSSDADDDDENENDAVDAADDDDDDDDADDEDDALLDDEDDVDDGFMCSAIIPADILSL